MKHDMNTTLEHAGEIIETLEKTMEVCREIKEKGFRVERVEISCDSIKPPSFDIEINCTTE